MKTHITKIILYIGLIAFSINSQAQWTPQTTGFSQLYRAARNISIVNSTTAWISGYSAVNQPNVQDYARTTDGGNTWAPAQIAIANNYDFSNIYAIDANTAWATMYNATSGGGFIAKTTNGGNTWSQQLATGFAAPNGLPNFVYFFDVNNGVIVGNPNGGYFEIYTTSNGGGSWTRVLQTNIPANNANEIGNLSGYSVIGNKLWFGTTTGRIYISSDKGLTWSVFTTGSGFISKVVFKDANNGLALDSSGAIKSSTNGGTTWSSVNKTGIVFPSDMACIPGTGTYVSAGFNKTLNYSGSSYSTDNGATWTLLDSSVNHYTALSFLNNTTGWSGGYNTAPATGGIYKWTGICSQQAKITSSAGTTLCAGGQLTLSATTGNGFTYQWYKNGAILSGSTTSSITVTGTGSSSYFDYTVAINNGSCTKVAGITLNDSPSPAVINISAAGNTTICAGDKVVLSNTDNGVSYQWQQNGTDIPNATNASYTATASGNYLVKMVNNTGCISTSNTITVTIKAGPSANVTVLQGHTALCGAKDSAVFTSNTGGGYTYQWKNGNNSINGATQNKYTANAVGSYYVVITNSTGCSSASTPVSVTTGLTPKAQFGFTANGKTITTTDLSTAAAGYSWKFGDGNTATTATPTHVYAASGTYTVCMKVTNACGTDSICKTVTATNAGIAENVSLQSVAIYPNPAADNLTIALQLNRSSDIIIRLYDLLGHELLNFKDFANGTYQHKINTTELSPGIYLIKLSVNKEFTTRKVTISR